jgi:hypothetical protein
MKKTCIVFSVYAEQKLRDEFADEVRRRGDTISGVVIRMMQNYLAEKAKVTK